MRLAKPVLVVVALLASLAPSNAMEPVGASQVALGFNGGSTWTSGSTGICIWYFPVVGDVGLESLFSADGGASVVDRAHSYLIWVSDFSVQMLPPSGGSGNPLYLFLAPAGTATIYFNPDPDTRDWTDLKKRSTWGEPVARLIREPSLVRSGDSLATDTFIFSAKLVSSETFNLNGKRFNFRDVIPNGMTCYEFGQNGSSWEAGTCTAIGIGR